MAQSIAETFRRARDRLGLSQSELAIHLDVSQAALSMIEAGRRKPSLKATQRLAELLKVPLQELLGSGELGRTRPAIVKLVKSVEPLGDDDINVLRLVAEALSRKKPD